MRIRTGILSHKFSFAAVVRKLRPKFEIKYICEADSTPIQILNPCCVEWTSFFKLSVQ